MSNVVYTSRRGRYELTFFVDHVGRDGEDSFARPDHLGGAGERPGICAAAGNELSDRSSRSPRRSASRVRTANAIAVSIRRRGHTSVQDTARLTQIVAHFDTDHCFVEF